MASIHVSKYACGNYTYYTESRVFKGTLVLTQQS